MFILLDLFARFWIKVSVILHNAANMYSISRFVVVALLFYVHGKHLRSCRDGQLT